MRPSSASQIGVNRGLPRTAWVLLALLLVSTVIFLFGRSDAATKPGAESTLPSGTAAFAELLRRNGFKVEIEFNPRPVPPSGALAIAYVTDEGFFESGVDRQVARDYLQRWIDKGNRALLIGMPSSFARATSEAREEMVMFDADPVVQRKVTVGGYGAYVAIDSDDTVPVWSPSPYGEFVSLMAVGDGFAVSVDNGLGSTNRFIDKADNARFYLDLVRTYATDNRVVFVEGLFGNIRDPGVIASIGSWASAAWWQFLLVALVVIFTLGKRFGLPVVERVSQKGGRELVDAMADAMARGRQTDLALHLIAADIDLRLRRDLSLGAEVSSAERDRYLPPDLAQALREAETVSDKVPAPEAARLARRLLHLYQEFAASR